ncbi:hypothetical protein Glove_199g68 [Diversispora epigaea]|uniref:Uncharacterized protein n=1 Tax=Diversispora epigaea TaxID=1348612 RepID=A0A397IUD7_9GLOM|nr:hypothetical protein Glove_199g68 [Diversispora epigaea]
MSLTYQESLQIKKKLNVLKRSSGEHIPSPSITIWIHSWNIIDLYYSASYANLQFHVTFFKLKYKMDIGFCKSVAENLATIDYKTIEEVALGK